MHLPESMSREAVCALRPAELLADGLSSPLPDALRALGPVALAEQLRAEGTPREALELWIATLAAVEAPAGPGLDAAALARLPEGLEMQAADAPAALAWARALGPLVRDADTLRGALELLLLAVQFWVLTDALRQRRPGGADGSDGAAGSDGQGEPP
jgi:hypothetical protein